MVFEVYCILDKKLGFANSIRLFRDTKDALVTTKRDCQRLIRTGDVPDNYFDDFDLVKIGYFDDQFDSDEFGLTNLEYPEHYSLGGNDEL